MGSARPTLERLYDAFGRCDGATMASCYAADAHFADPVYPNLHGPQVGAMWRMLTGRAQDLTVEVRSLTADESTGSATWMAHYRSARTAGRSPTWCKLHVHLHGRAHPDERDEFDFHGGRRRRWVRRVASSAGRRSVRKSRADQGRRGPARMLPGRREGLVATGAPGSGVERVPGAAGVHDALPLVWPAVVSEA